MMASPRVLKFDRSDDDSSPVLLHVTPKGPKPLDLKLVATEGSARYDATLKHSKVASLRVKNCAASEEEWQAILQSLLEHEPLPDIQASVTVQEESSISITIRKQVQGITQRLGAITLKYEPDEIMLFEWCATAADASSESKLAAASSTAKVRDLEVAVDELKAQLDELVQAKGEDETVLLQKFRDLLNEKKVKIREQQKILSSASFNASLPGSSQPSQPAAPQPARKPAKSRATKRKAPAKAVEPEEDEDEGLQEMDVDKIKSEPEETDPGNTSEATASISSDEENEDIDARAPPPQNKTATLPPPPRRTLPFVNKKPAIPTAVPAAGSETESDDEL